MVMTIPRRKYLADALHETLAELEKAFVREDQGRHIGIFLQHEISRHADERTLEQILEDAEHELRQIRASEAGKQS